MTKSGFIYGSFIMILLNLINRLIDFVYDVSLSNILGAEAMGVFQMGMSTLMIFIIVTTSGMSTALTKIVAEENSKGNSRNVQIIFRTTLIFNFFLSIILVLILFLLSDLITIKIFKNEYLIYGVYSLAPAIIILSISNIYRAYFYGLKNVTSPSIAQIIEHLTRFIFVIGIFLLFKPVNPLQKAVIALFGISIGEFFDLLYSIFSKRSKYSTNMHSIKDNNSFALFSKLLLISLPLTLSGFFNVVLRFINTILLPSRLIVAGFTESEAISALGRINGMVMPLIGLAFMFTSPLVVNLIPNISEHIVYKRYKNINKDIRLAIKATFLLATPLTILFIILSKPLALFLYKDPIVAEYLGLLGFGTIILALSHTFAGILYGLNMHVIATFNRIICMILSVILMYFLVGNPNWGIKGYFISFYISNILIILLDIRHIKKIVKLNINLLDIIGKPLFASIFMALYIKFTTYDIRNLQNENLFSFLFSLSIAFLAYIFILISTKAIPKDFIKALIDSKRN